MELIKQIIYFILFMVIVYLIFFLLTFKSGGKAELTTKADEIEVPDITKPELSALIIALNHDNEFCSRRYKSTPMTSAQALNWIEQNAIASQRERLAFRKIANEPRIDLAPVEDRSIQYNAEETARFEASIANKQDNSFSSAN